MLELSIFFFTKKSQKPFNQQVMIGCVRLQHVMQILFNTTDSDISITYTLVKEITLTNHCYVYFIKIRNVLRTSDYKGSALKLNS